MFGSQIWAHYVNLYVISYNLKACLGYHLRLDYTVTFCACFQTLMPRTRMEVTQAKAWYDCESLSRHDCVDSQ
jgi:hypothetical protein